MADSITWANDDELIAADLEGVTGGFTPDQLTYWLDRARRTILAEVTADTLAQRIREQKIDKDAPKDVQIELVLSKLGNPGGIRTVQESNGPTSGSVTYGGDSPGQLTLTAQHRRLLGFSTKGRRAAGTVDTWR